MVPLGRHRDTRAVHEHDLPEACLLLEKGRFQPILIHGAGRIIDAALIDVSNPCRLAADVDVGLGHIPFVALARGMLCLDEGHDGISIESRASVIYVKVRCNDGIELRNIIRSSCG
ncbi:MAG: hypothetical protein QOJ51_5491 [Acidobacteriaceae bacterium]|nr:hypothetical protein [Acidobacteriaceae bacterium]